MLLTANAELLSDFPSRSFIYNFPNHCLPITDLCKCDEIFLFFCVCINVGYKSSNRNKAILTASIIRN